MRKDLRLIFVLSLAACNGGGGTPTYQHGAIALPSPGGATPTPPGIGPSGTVRFVLSIPVATTAAVKFHTESYVSAKTQSIGAFVSTVNGVAPPTTIDAISTVGAPGSTCSVGSGTLTCTISLAAPPGDDTFSLRTYAQTDAQGNPLSVGTARATVVVGSTTAAVTDALLPVVSSLVATRTPDSLPIGSPGTVTVSFVGKDSAGDPIGGPDPYYKPILVTAHDTSAHLTATPPLPASITGPGQSIVFTYDGKGSAASYQYDTRVPSDAIAAGPTTTTGVLLFSGGGEHLYVASQFDATVAVYDIGQGGAISAVPSRVLGGPATHLSRPTSITVDALGALYVVNYDTNVTVYAPGASGNAAPIATLADGAHPEFIGSDGSFDVAIGYAPSNGTGLDHTIENVYVTRIYQSPGVPGAPIVIQPAFIVENSSSFATSPLPGPSGFSIATCFGLTPPNDSNSVSCYANPLAVQNGHPTSANYRLPEIPTGIAFRSDGLLAVGSGQAYMHDPAVNTYALDGVPGYKVPTHHIGGSNTGLTSPTSLAFDKQGNIYVGDTGLASGNGSVRIWPMNADGNVAPRVISGLNYPFGIAVGP